ncbi:hypothetical protein [Mesorhizobium sp. WSM3224]|uniref:hypothetical protein n=1 Tax=Mesorhizobium sp. WSM3224 TaxID=1040986 RepID=UPI00056CD033|nr:hypothetical protein [Mesorhizobium sp. WSM3224]
MTARSEERPGNDLDEVRLADIRAATMLRESAPVSFDPSIEIALAEAAAEMKVARSDVIRLVLQEWLAIRQKALLK